MLEAIPKDKGTRIRASTRKDTTVTTKGSRARQSQSMSRNNNKNTQAIRGHSRGSSVIYESFFKPMPPKEGVNDQQELSTHYFAIFFVMYV